MIRETLVAPLPPSTWASFERIMADARLACDLTAWTAQLNVGRTMTIETAVAFALEEPVPDVPADADLIGHKVPSEKKKRADVRATNLTAREMEVARLVAQGLTDRAIADRLAISRRTVDTHLRRMFTKAQVSSRAGFAVWAVSHALVESSLEARHESSRS
jgi:DNA-binding CsgD family transcriptional regulator